MTDRNLFNAPDGVTIKVVIIIMVQHYWGRGESITEAWENVKKESGQTLRDLKRGSHLIYSAFDYITDDEKTTIKSYVDGFGSVNYHRDYPATIIHQQKR